MEQNGWGCISVRNEDDNVIEEIHIIYGKIDKSGNFLFHGHILNGVCDCRPRVEIDKMIPIITHKPNV